MSSADDLRGFIDALYETALDPRRLTVLLQELTASFQSDAGIFLVNDTPRRRVAVNVMTSIDPSEAVRFEQAYAFEEPDAPWNGGHTPLQNTRWMAERLVPTGFHSGFGIQVMLEDSTPTAPSGVAFLGLLQRRAGKVSPESVIRLESMRPHLPHAARLLRRVADAETASEVNDALLDTIAAPLAVAEISGHIVFSNSAARYLLDSGDGVRTIDGRICATTDRYTAKLRALIAEIALPPAGATASKGAALALPRSRAPGMIGIVARPIRRRTGSLSGNKPLIALHFSVPESLTPPPEDILRGLFSLTPAEARLLRALTVDKRLEEYAGERGVSVTTVRTQLAHLFRKTGTNRQSELVRLALVASGPF